MGLCRKSAQFDRASTIERVQLDGHSPRCDATLRPRICFGAMCVFGRLQSIGEDLVEPASVLQPDANAHERRRHAVLRRPIELVIEREDRVRACEGKVRAQAGTLGACKRVVERLCSALPSEREREEAAEAAAGRTPPARGVVGRGLPFRVEDLCDRRGGGGGRLVGLRGRVQETAHALGVRVNLRRPL